MSNFFRKIGHALENAGEVALGAVAEILMAGRGGDELKQFHRSVCLGKAAPRVDSRTLRLGKYISLLPAPPVSIDWTTKMSNLGFMVNDQLGDCTCAAAGHLVQEWTANVGSQIILPDAAILKAYEDVGGYAPGNPATDQGAVEIDVLNYWRQTGIGGHKILGYMSINVQNQKEIQTAIDLFGGVYIGLSMPLAWQGTQHWDVSRGFAKLKRFFGGGGEWEPGSWGGHAVPLCGYDALGNYRLITWGSAAYTITPDAMAEYCDEAYAVLSQQDWTGAKGLSPSDFDLAQLKTDLSEIV